MKNFLKKETMIVSIIGTISLLLVGNTIFPTASAQSTGNMTNSMDEAIKSKMQTSPQELRVPPNAQVFVVICTAPQQCQAFDLVLLPPNQ